MSIDIMARVNVAIDITPPHHNKQLRDVLHRYLQFSIEVSVMLCTSGRSTLSRLKLKDGPKECFRRGRQKADFCVGMEPVEDRRLGRQAFRDVAVITLKI
jgi:hypothetical protein